MRILLADDHALVRAGIRHLVESFEGCTVVAEADNDAAALAAATLHRPDVAIIDLSMPERGGLALIDDLKTCVPDTAVIVLSMHAQGEYVREAVRRGARGFIPKEAAPAELRAALDACVKGQRYLSPVLAQSLVDELVRAGRSSMAAVRLSARQRQVLHLIANGHPTREIARLMGVSVKTVETHRARLMQSLNVRGTSGLLRYALREGYGNAVPA